MQFRMAGASINPTFSNGDVLDVLRYSAPVANGDIILFAAPTSPTRDFLKRVIAGPGQTVHIGPGGVVSVDGETFDEPFAQGVSNCAQVVSCMFEVPGNDAPAVPDPNASPRAKEIGGDQPECETIACYFVMGTTGRTARIPRRGGWCRLTTSSVTWRALTPNASPPPGRAGAAGGEGQHVCR